MWRWWRRRPAPSAEVGDDPLSIGRIECQPDPRPVLWRLALVVDGALSVQNIGQAPEVADALRRGLTDVERSLYAYEIGAHHHIDLKVEPMGREGYPG